MMNIGFLKTRVLLFLILLNIMLVKASEPSRYPINPAGVWKVYITSDEYVPGAPANEEFIKYYISNDTIINTQAYYKVYKTGTAYYDEPFRYEHIYVGALRDEANRMYFIKKNALSEVLLFDFNLKIDDTIKSVIGKDHIINEIDSLNDGRKKIGSIPFICAGCCPAPILIEGIGHADGLFEEPACNHPGYQFNKLICYTEDDNIIYQSDYLSLTCDSFTNVKPIKGDLTEINIYPVPATNKISVEFSNINEYPSVISIYNTCGSLVYSKNIQYKINKLEIDVQGLKRGIYFISIKNKELVGSKMIILE